MFLKCFCNQSYDRCEHGWIEFFSFIFQVSVYAAALFEQLGSFRRNILLALTNLKEITFLRVTRDPGTGVTGYEISDGIRDVLGALCHVLKMEAAEVR